MATRTTNIILEHVRSFAEAQSIALRPLTLLVGENSSGKSTFMAIAGCVFDREGFPSRPGFNEPPFSLGTYETIATFKGGKYGRDDSFSIGYSLETDDKVSCEVKATYERGRGSPALVRFEGRSDIGSIDLQTRGERLSGEVCLAARATVPEQRVGFRDSSDGYNIFRQAFSPGNLIPLLVTVLERPGESDLLKSTRELFNLGYSLLAPFSAVVPFAPIRTKPRRTYDDLSEDYSPEGDHVPKVLARILNEENTSEPTGRVRKALHRFGAESGLFKQIEVKSLGRGPDDPFQVQVGVGGPKVNLVDVGYGVSQALPVIVQSAIRQDNSLLLIQQPEVHLHPRAQAALGTFFAELAAVGNDTILVETHSDHLVDRIRREVARGTIMPDQVQILFFSKEKLVTTVHPIHLDRMGNVIGAPDHYRRFFLEEEIGLLSRGGD